MDSYYQTQILHYKDIHQAEPYFNLVRKLYQNKKGFTHYFNDLVKGMKYTLQSEYQTCHAICIRNNDGLLAHIALIEDVRLPAREAFFGFFECLQNDEVFTYIWNTLKTQAEKPGITKMLGPINGSIWHSYRVISESNPAYPGFSSEPITQDWYCAALKNQQPLEVISYHSASRKNFTFIAEHTRQAYQEAMHQGYSIEEPKVIEPGLLEQLFTLSKLVFRENWGYVDLNFNEFLDLYSTEKIAGQETHLYLLRKDEMLVGFCSTLRDGDTLIMKTIAVHPNLQGSGLGNALVHKIHADAISQQIPEIIYALVRKTNKVKNFPMDDVVVFREYAGFVLSV